MASRYGWPVALSLVALATVSTPAVPHARQTRPEHLRKADFDIRDTQPAAPSRLTPRASSRGGAPQRDRLNRESGSLRVLEQPGLTLDARSQSSAISRWLASEARRTGPDCRRPRLARPRPRLHHPRHRRPPPAVPAGARRPPGLRFRRWPSTSPRTAACCALRRMPPRVTGAARSRRLPQRRRRSPRGSTVTARPAPRSSYGCRLQARCASRGMSW